MTQFVFLWLIPRKCLQLVRRDEHKPDSGSVERGGLRRKDALSTCRAGSWREAMLGIFPSHRPPPQPSMEGDPEVMATSLLGCLGTRTAGAGEGLVLAGMPAE